MPKRKRIGPWHRECWARCRRCVCWRRGSGRVGKPQRCWGMIFQQSAFCAGALTASLPTLTVAEPVVASVLGVIVLG